MGDYEKIKFKGYSAFSSKKVERTISAVYDRNTEEMEIKLTVFDQLRYNMVILNERPIDGKAYRFVKVKIGHIVGEKDVEEFILLNGVAYVMSSDGTTIDTWSN